MQPMNELPLPVNVCSTKYKVNMKKALRETQTLRARAGCSKVRTPPARPTARLQTHKHTDRTDYNTLRR